MISISSTGNFDRTRSFINALMRGDEFAHLDQYGRIGVDALAKYTPKETGKTAQSWSYKVTKDRGGVKIEWFNGHVNDGVNIAIILQYGHGTGTGGYVSGTDYINPAIRPIFDKIADDVWRQVNKA